MDPGAPPGNGNVGETELQRGLDTVVHGSLPGFLGGIAVLFTVLAGLDLLTEPANVRIALALGDVVVASACAVGLVLLRRGRLRVEHAQATVVVVALLALGDILVSQSLSPDSSGAMVPVLVAIGVGSFLLHRGWFMVMLAGSVAALAVLVAAPAISLPGAFPVVAVVAGLALAVIVFVTRTRAYRGLLTERNRAERVASELEVSNRDLERFAYAAAHDLQEPIRTVVSHMQLLERRHGDALPEAARDTMGYVVGAGHRMKGQVDALLAYSRVQAHQPDPEVVDLDRVLGEVLEDLKAHLEGSGGVVQRDALPRVQGDPVLLRDVLLNLLSNALTYHDGHPPRVHVTATRDADMVRVSVRDEGIGLPPEHHEEVFDLFKRLHHPSRYPGTGIGLSLVKRIVERHGGDVGVESSPGEGSTFWFTVPAA